MAEEDKTKEGEEGSGGGKSKLILIIGAIVLLGGGAGGGYMFSQSNVPVEGEEEVVEVRDIAYLALDKPVIVNYSAADGKTRFLKTEVTLMMEGEDRKGMIKKHLPKIEHVMNMVFSRQNYEEIGTRDGKEKMRLEALQEIQTVLAEPVGDVNVEDIFFTSFATQ